MVADPVGREPGFRGLVSLAQWTRLIRDGVRHTFARGEFLLHQGEPGGRVRLLTAGRVKVVFVGEDGTESLLCLRGPGEILGELSDPHTERMATVRAVESCVTYSMTVTMFRRYLRDNDLEAAFHRYTAGKMRQSGSQQWAAHHRRLESRLADLLLTARRVAGPDHRDPNRVPLSQDELASALGVVRSSVTPWIKAWKETGLVAVERGSVVIGDPVALAEVARRV